jgi:hypothetical protein
MHVLMCQWKPRPREWALSHPVSPPPWRVVLELTRQGKVRVCRSSIPRHSLSLRARRLIQFFLAEVLNETNTSTLHIQSGQLAGPPFVLSDETFV